MNSRIFIQKNFTTPIFKQSQDLKRWWVARWMDFNFILVIVNFISYSIYIWVVPRFINFFGISITLFYLLLFNFLFAIGAITAIFLSRIKGVHHPSVSKFSAKYFIIILLLSLLFHIAYTALDLGQI